MNNETILSPAHVGRLVTLLFGVLERSRERVLVQVRVWTTTITTTRDSSSVQVALPAARQSSRCCKKSQQRGSRADGKLEMRIRASF